MSENSVHVYDVDQDGWLDVIAGGWGEDGIYWYRNPGRSAAERGEPRRMHAAWESRLLARTRGHMEMFALHDIESEVLAASIRHPLHVTQAALAGAHIATVPFKVMQQMIRHPLTDKGIVQFRKDWEGARAAVAAKRT